MYLSSTTPHIGHLGSSVKGTGGGAWPTPLPYQKALPPDMASIYHPSAMFASAVIAQDMMVGAVLDELSAQGTINDTVVFFSGDNGQGINWLFRAENLLENTDGVPRPTPPPPPALVSRGSSLLPSVYADARCIDDVIVF